MLRSARSSTTPVGSSTTPGTPHGSRARLRNETSYGSFASFSDPDGNGWILQEVTTRLPGRVTSAAYESVSDLAESLRRAAAAHGKHEAEIGEADANWPQWYAQFMVDERTGQ